MKNFIILLLSAMAAHAASTNQFDQVAANGGNFIGSLKANGQDVVTNGQQNVYLGGTEYTINTNRLEFWGATIAAANGTFNISNGVYYRGNGPFCSNYSAAPIVWGEYTAGVLRYFITNATPTGTNWTPVTGTAPFSVFHSDSTNRGSVYFVNGTATTTNTSSHIAGQTATFSSTVSAAYFVGDISGSSNLTLAQIPVEVVTNNRPSVTFGSVTVSNATGSISVTPTADGGTLGGATVTAGAFTGTNGQLQTLIVTGSQTNGGGATAGSIKLWDGSATYAQINASASDTIGIAHLSSDTIRANTLSAADGSLVSNLNASVLSSGTVPNARLTGTSQTNVTLVNATNNGTLVLQTNTSSSPPSFGLNMSGGGATNIGSLAISGLGVGGIVSSGGGVQLQSSSATTTLNMTGARFNLVSSFGTTDSTIQSDNNIKLVTPTNKTVIVSSSLYTTNLAGTNFLGGNNFIATNVAPTFVIKTNWVLGTLYTNSTASGLQARRASIGASWTCSAGAAAGTGRVTLSVFSSTQSGVTNTAVVSASGVNLLTNEEFHALEADPNDTFVFTDGSSGTGSAAIVVNSGFWRGK